jgi:hypothetical protein
MKPTGWATPRPAYVYTDPATGNARDICAYDAAVNAMPTAPTR